MKKLYERLNIKPSEYYGTLFTVGLGLAAAVVLNRQFRFLPGFVDGLFSGLSITLMLIGGAKKCRGDDTKQ